MDSIAGIAYTTVEFDQDGHTLKAPALAGDVQELIIISHGWNNNRAEAEALYQKLFANFAGLGGAREKKIAIVGVLWPSKTFDFSAPSAPAAPAGMVGAASVGNAGGDAEEAALARAFDEFAHVFAGSGKEAQVAALRDLQPRLADPAAQAEFVVRLRAIVAPPAADGDFDASPFFTRSSDPGGVFANASQASSDVGDGMAAGDTDMVTGAGFGDVVSGVANGVSDLLNIGSYYEMKKRAGTIGTVGLAPLIDALAAFPGVQHVHLVGHSFGARLVTAAAMASTTNKLYSLTLLQAAFSHNGFSDAGFFRKVYDGKRLAGPIVITHTVNDLAVGKAYAIASRLARDATAGVGDANDAYGGLGRNGAVRMGKGEVSQAADALLPEQRAYRLENGLIHNLESSAFIKGHGDVAGAQVAWLISSVMATAP